jgi:uncharacterized protein (DUF1330 family)
MAAYIIGNIDGGYAEAYVASRETVAATIEQYGGRYLVRGGKADLREGDWTPHRILVLEFSTMAQAVRWYESPEYAPIKELRLANARSDILFVEGV